MFKCVICDEVVGPRISAVKVVTGIREVSYHNEYTVEDEWGNKEKREVDSVGTEITGESLMCPQCADQPVRVSGLPKLFKDFGFREEPAPVFKVKLASHAIESVLSNLEHGNREAKQGAENMVPLVKGFLDANKGIAV